MALDHEEMRRRRQQRQAQRLEQQKMQRRAVIKLIAAAAVVIFCVVLIVVLARGGSGETVETQPTEPVQTQPAETQLTDPQQLTEPTQPPAKTVIHLAAAGDLNVTPEVTASGGADYDYTNMLLDVVPVLAQADITVVNLEGCLVGAPYGEDRSAPQNLMKSLSLAGVDLVQLANSYSIYKGMDGLSQTISGVRAAGMEPVGVYATAQQANEGKGYTIRNVNGVKIAFVAFTKGMDGMALPPGNDGCVNLLYTDYATDYQTVDTQGITRVLQAAAKEKPDLTVALLHWGSEFNDTISTSQGTIRDLMLKNGVDAIIGTHAHYVQQMALDETAGTFVAYSLGDFAGDAKRAGSEYSVILDLEITKENGQTRITGYSYTPIFISAREGQPVRVLRIREAMKAFEDNYIDRVTQAEYDAMAYALGRIEDRIKGK